MSVPPLRYSRDEHIRYGWLWRNFHRGTDPIGGRIDGPAPDWPVDQPIKTNLKKNHINYWIEWTVVKFLLEEGREDRSLPRG